MANWSATSSEICVAKSTEGRNFAGLLCCVLAVDLKRLVQAARGVRRNVHHLEQQHIAQLATTVKVALRKNIVACHHDIHLASGLKSQNPKDYAHKLAS